MFIPLLLISGMLAVCSGSMLIGIRIEENLIKSQQDLIEDLKNALISSEKVSESSNKLIECQKNLIKFYEETYEKEKISNN